MLIKEVTSLKPIKPLTPDQARLKSMKDRLKLDQEALKAERAKQKFQKAQQNLGKVLKAKSIKTWRVEHDKSWL